MEICTQDSSHPVAITKPYHKKHYHRSETRWVPIITCSTTSLVPAQKCSMPGPEGEQGDLLSFLVQRDDSWQASYHLPKMDFPVLAWCIYSYEEENSSISLGRPRTSNFSRELLVLKLPILLSIVRRGSVNECRPSSNGILSRGQER